jgi:tetratricopeptide (TPR) repeat protein/tRNA A-37 threonylcarbamoyl transferase component Bud32
VDTQNPKPQEASTPAPTADTLSTGAVFGGRYEIQRLVGEGAMGRVYAARDLELERVVALKMLRSGRGQTDALSAHRLMRELALARGIVHRNVVRIHDIGEAAGNKFFTMEFIEGESLDTLIRARGRIPPGEAIALARQVLAALAAAHGQGVVHRDLKPRNVLVDPSGTAHVADFGIARPSRAEGIPATGMEAGTTDYLSAEQLSGGEVGPASDIYSFGVILYEMLAGQLPFHADATAVTQVAATPRSLRDVAPDIPERVEAVVMKCLADRALRYGSVAEVLEDLDGDASRLLRRRTVRAIARRKGILGWTGVAVVAAVFAVHWLARRPGATLPADGSVLAILPFTNVTGDANLEWLRTGLPEMLVTDLSQSRYVRPVRGDRVARVLEQAGLSGQSRFDEAALESVAKSTRSQSVVTGQFLQLEGRLRVELMLRKSGAGVSVPLRVETAASDVFGLVDAITRRVKEHLDLSPKRLRGDVDRPVFEVSTASIDAMRACMGGLTQMRRGANQEAVDLLERATRLDPSFAMAYARLAEARLALGRTSEATTAADRARALSKKEPLPLAERHEIHVAAALARNDYASAARSYEDLLELYPEDPDLRMGLAHAYEKMSRLPEAIDAYQRVTRLEPLHGPALMALGRVQAMSGRAEAAIGSLRRALDTKQFDAQPEALATIHSTLGAACRDVGHLEEALDHLGRSLEIRKAAGDIRGQIATLIDLASVRERRGEMEEALDMEGRAVTLARDLGDTTEESKALDVMASTYEGAGKLDKALGTYRESLQIEKERRDDVAVANRLDRIANIYRLQGKFDDALASLEQAKSQLGPSGDRRETARNLAFAGEVRGAQGLYDQAVEAYLASLPLFQETGQRAGVARVHRELARIYSSQGRYADAYEALGQSLEICRDLRSPHDVVEATTALGRLLGEMGLLAEAEKKLAEADRVAREGKVDGALPEILLGQAEVAHLRGDAASAADLYDRANVEANLRGRKDVAVESRVGLGLLYLGQGKRVDAERLLARARRDAVEAPLRPVEASTRSALADVHLAGKSWAAARREAQEAVALAEALSLRPILWRALFSTARALDGLGRGREAVDAYARAASTLDSMRGALAVEQAAAFTARPDVQAFAREAFPKLEKGGRTAEADLLREWVASAAAPVP